uniref:Uncharacterized protein n=1 Tax=virus sp. ctEfN2 TaxID=2825810 RepID=A0A8S5RM62_9VIRU|nr:MAG TPA: hypothetical protein [virus sp. ctEfN2]
MAYNHLLYKLFNLIINYIIYFFKNIKIYNLHL